MMGKKRWICHFSSWTKKHYRELLGLLFIVGLGVALQMIGCNQPAHFFYSAPEDFASICDDVDMSILTDAECEETAVSPADAFEDCELSEEGCPEWVLRCRENPEDCEYQRKGFKGDEDYLSRLRVNKVPVITQTVQLGKVDIIFAVDNSHSMEVEHKNIADQFDKFVEDIEDLDYRIAMVTVDISSSPNNTRREYQDGDFIEFEDGSTYLYNDETSVVTRRKRHRENVKLFKKAIERPETRRCQRDETACPDDERAICALNMAFDKSGDFFRPDGHLMVIVISDEDERSSKEVIDGYKQRGEYGYDYEPCDYPDTFYTNVATKINKSKSVSVHAIIIPEGDSACLNEQNRDGGRGWEGLMYEDFVNPPTAMRDDFERTLKISFRSIYRRGGVYSICDRDYQDQLGELARFLVVPDPITLPCVPEEVRVRVVGGDQGVRNTTEGRVLNITEEVPINAKLRITTTCQVYNPGA